jgi:hypothetical protein
VAMKNMIFWVVKLCISVKTTDASKEGGWTYAELQGVTTQRIALFRTDRNLLNRLLEGQYLCYKHCIDIGADHSGRAV